MPQPSLIEPCGLVCPNCGARSTFTDHSAINREPHGEVFIDEWLTCDTCGTNTDQAEVDELNYVDEEEPPELDNLAEEDGEWSTEQTRAYDEREARFWNHGVLFDEWEDDTRDYD